LHGDVGGTISNRKGVNVPDVVLPLAALSDKDRAIWNSPAIWGWTGWRCPSCSAQDVTEARAWPMARGDPVQDREARRR
jgi:pyruvate kinase